MADTSIIAADERMTRTEAVKTIVGLCGGTRRHVNGDATTYVFTSLLRADHCKAVLDALLPAGSTGDVCGSGLLMVMLADPAQLPPNDDAWAAWPE